MNILVAIGIYSIVKVIEGGTRPPYQPKDNVMEKDTSLPFYQPYSCLFYLKNLESNLHKVNCPSPEFISPMIDQIRKTCQKTCIISNTIQLEECQNTSLKIKVVLNEANVIKKKSQSECQIECHTTISCKINLQLEDTMEIIYWLLDQQNLCTCLKRQSCTYTLCTYNATSTPKPLPACMTEAVSTEEQKQITTTSSGYRGNDESDCPGLAVGVGLVGGVVGVIITSIVCIWWSRRKQPKKCFEGQAMTNKGYFTTGDEKIDNLGTKPRQRSVIYTEINDDPTYGHPKVSHVAPIIRDTERKSNSASNDTNVYNHLNEEINEDDADDYDHARSLPVQNNEAENGYGKLDKMADTSKSVQDDKRVSSSSMNHDYGELEIEEIEGVKKSDDDTKGTETDEIVGNGDNDNYFTLERSHI